jgi:hypothetical protein
MNCADWNGSRDISALIKRKLTDLLPEIRGSDANLIAPYQWLCLCRHLITWDRTEFEFAIAILKALERAGPHNAISYVAKLAGGRWLAARIPGVRRAAEACLPVLRSRAKGYVPSKELVPPSDAHTQAHALLREASRATPRPNASSDLLRPN